MSGQVAVAPTRLRTTQGGVVTVVNEGGGAGGAEGFSPTGNFPSAFRQQDLGK